jgi:polyribonucleotide nucleotidyltransferase
MSGKENIFVPVTDRFIRGLVIGNGGKNIKEIKRQTHTKIRTCDENSSGKELGFEITGTATCCEEARKAILRIVVSDYAIQYTWNVPQPILL